MTRPCATCAVWSATVTPLCAAGVSSTTYPGGAVQAGRADQFLREPGPGVGASDVISRATRRKVPGDGPRRAAPHLLLRVVAGSVSASLGVYRSFAGGGHDRSNGGGLGLLSASDGDRVVGRDVHVSGPRAVHRYGEVLPLHVPVHDGPQVGPPIPGRTAPPQLSPSVPSVARCVH